MEIRKLRILKNKEIKKSRNSENVGNLKKEEIRKFRKSEKEGNKKKQEIRKSVKFKKNKKIKILGKQDKQEIYKQEI